MYFPYYRGKQFELISIRESVGTIASAGFIPIIEPVREQFSGLKKALDEINSSGSNAIVIVNPQVGDLINRGDEIIQLIKANFKKASNIEFGFAVTNSMSVESVKKEMKKLDDRPVNLIHMSFRDAKALGNWAGTTHISKNIFFGNGQYETGKIYQRHFGPRENRVLLKNGFTSRRNRDHPDDPELFSELHVTYDSEGVGGFGDFLTVGEDYSESGGPAYTVAIHLTYIDASLEDMMYIQHFKSERQNSPSDPAGKFAEALNGLINTIENHPDRFIDSSAIQEFRRLFKKGHYPGLGYVKKLSINHHIETMARFMGGDES